MSQGIDFLICGLEHSGTTLASDLVRDSSCDSGFECGVLLSESPEGFLNNEPFASNILNGWKITKEDLTDCCQSKTFPDFYDKLYAASKLFNAKNISRRFDKTPRYITQLSRIQEEHDIPALALIKDPRSIAWSDFKRSKKPLSELDDWYSEWLPKKKRYMESAYEGYLYAWGNPNKCLVMRLEDICLEAKKSLQLIDDFLEIPFSYNQLFFPDKRTDHTRGKSIDSSIAISWLQEMPQKTQESVSKDFKIFDRWFYRFEV